MTQTDYVVHSGTLPTDQSGELIQLSREEAGWEWMSFFVRRLTPGLSWECFAGQEEVALVLLGGQCSADWGQGKKPIGKRKNVFMAFLMRFISLPGAMQA